MGLFRRLSLFACALVVCGVARASERPNVVLIVSDDQAWSDFGFMGHEDIATPSLDRLAADGVVFTRGYVPSSLCRPSLATMISGLYPHQHQITGNDPPDGIPREQMLQYVDRMQTLPDWLAGAGYRSFQSGKWWEGHYRRGGFSDGMTHGDPKRGGRHGDAGLGIGREGLKPILDFIDGCGAAPFFVWYAPFLPHRPHNPPARLLDKYRAADRSVHVARYYAMCEWFDETCGKLLDYLDDKKLARNTLVVFVADNGWIQRPDRQGYAARSKRSPYEGGIRTPIIVRWPEASKDQKPQPGGRASPSPATKSKRIQYPVSSIDLVPTILSACGIPVPATLPGIDLRRMASESPPARTAVFGAAFTHDVVELGAPARSLRQRWMVEQRWKLIQPEDSSKAAELYDLIADPTEQRDLASEQPKRVRSMRTVLDQWWAAQ